jgi:hypothetical protein
MRLGAGVEAIHDIEKVAHAIEIIQDSKIMSQTEPLVTHDILTHNIAVKR